ncbi:hypothetical protein B0T18DRAFT_419089 [Schizothecium vesticola]|uniref:Uncharacterized protein n=1 Tax=Schizothecium vesticola TaxID=314040 RepID=A0AA40EKI4_9PEZI|nr:hypothetical protein B0T18DRAFT_419089 [Schizothecium vesticola]
MYEEHGGYVLEVVVPSRTADDDGGRWLSFNEPPNTPVNRGALLRLFNPVLEAPPLPSQAGYSSTSHLRAEKGERAGVLMAISPPPRHPALSCSRAVEDHGRDCQGSQQETRRPREKKI